MRVGSQVIYLPPLGYGLGEHLRETAIQLDKNIAACATSAQKKDEQDHNSMRLFFGKIIQIRENLETLLHHPKDFFPTERFQLSTHLIDVTRIIYRKATMILQDPLITKERKAISTGAQVIWSEGAIARLEVLAREVHAAYDIVQSVEMEGWIQSEMGDAEENISCLSRICQIVWSIFC